MWQGRPGLAARARRPCHNQRGKSAAGLLITRADGRGCFVRPENRCFAASRMPSTGRKRSCAEVAGRILPLEQVKNHSSAAFAAWSFGVWEPGCGKGLVRSFGRGNEQDARFTILRDSRTPRSESKQQEVGCVPHPTRRDGTVWGVMVSGASAHGKAAVSPVLCDAGML